MPDLSNIIFEEEDVNNPQNVGEKPTGTPDPNDNNNNEQHDSDNHDSDNHDNDNHDDNASTLAEGTELETPDGNFKVDANGNLVKEDGTIFKEAKDVKAYIDQFDDSSNEDNFSIDALRSLVDVEVTDENGKPVEFTDDAEGRQAYMNKVIELKQNEASKIALDTFFTKNPLVKFFTDFIATGGNPRDFGKIPDRTGIQFDENNAEQHKAILKMAFTEKGMTNVEGYIKYLEDSGALADNAKKELDAMQKADRDYREKKAIEAKQQAEQERAETEAYYNTLLNKINSGVIGGYKIPENVTVERNGQKLNLNRKDFFDYIARIDQNGKSAYVRDLDSMSDDDFYNRELLDAWMHFTGGSYKTLVDMAVRENEVAKLKLVAKKANSKSKGTVQIHKPAGSGSSIKDIIL